MGTLGKIYVCVAGLTLGSSACISTDSEVLEATEGCDEIEAGQIADLDLDPDAKAFISASVDLEGAALQLSEDVYTACAGIATDLGAADTWSGLETLEARISNSERTGACDAAALNITERIEAAGGAEAQLKLAIARGECHVAFDAQAQCDAECAANTRCDPGSIETRCEPARISAYCSGSCEAEAYCVGTAEVAANCSGACEGSCQGECQGTCYLEDGSVNENDLACAGKCVGQCVGQCYGQCKVEAEAGVQCGNDVRCQGGCQGELVAPACTTEYTPPSCEVDTACYESCSARLIKEATCEPTSVRIIANVESSAELEPVVTSLEAHLPTLYAAAESQGLLIKHAAERLSDAGASLSDRVDDLDGKSLACVTTSTTGLVDSLGALEVSINASVEVKGCVDVE